MTLFRLDNRNNRPQNAMGDGNALPLAQNAVNGGNAPAGAHNVGLDNLALGVGQVQEGHVQNQVPINNLQDNRQNQMQAGNAQGGGQNLVVAGTLNGAGENQFRGIDAVVDGRMADHLKQIIQESTQRATRAKKVYESLYGKYQDENADGDNGTLNGRGGRNRRGGRNLTQRNTSYWKGQYFKVTNELSRNNGNKTYIFKNN